MRKCVTKIEKLKITQSFEKLEALTRYNFFTSLFFSAVDIVTDKKRDTVILTNLNDVNDTRIDLINNTFQIWGRF